jgi:hypothetical protein
MIGMRFPLRELHRRACKFPSGCLLVRPAAGMPLLANAVRLPYLLDDETDLLLAENRAGVQPEVGSKKARWTAADGPPAIP